MLLKLNHDLNVMKLNFYLTDFIKCVNAFHCLELTELQIQNLDQVPKVTCIRRTERKLFVIKKYA